MEYLISIYMLVISFFVPTPFKEEVVVTSTSTPAIAFTEVKEKKVQITLSTPKVATKPVLEQINAIMKPVQTEIVTKSENATVTPVFVEQTATSPTPEKMVESVRITYQPIQTTVTVMETPTYEVSIGNQSCEVVKDAGNETYAFYTMNISDSIRKQGNYFEIKGTVTKDGEYVTDLGFSHTFTSNTQQVLRLEAFKREGTFTYTMLAKNQNGDTLFTGNGTLELAGCN